MFNLPIWKTLFITDTYVYILGKFNNLYILSSYARDSIPDGLKNSVFGGIYMHHNKYVHNFYAEQLTYLTNLRMKFPVIKSKDAFNCPVCFESSSLYTPISCIHKICSPCVSDIAYKTGHCPICKNTLDNMQEYKRKIFNDLPLSHVIRIMQTINIFNCTDNIKYVCCL